MTESQHRFLREIAARLPAAHIVELRLFPSLRQGRVESGVAVLAVEAIPLAPTTVAEMEAGVVATMPVGIEAPNAPPADGPLPVEEPGRPTDAPRSPVPPDDARPAPASVRSRFSILTAHYRLTLKGPDRGKWEFALVHDADAPLEALEQVARGVARRVGEAGEPEHLAGAEVQRAVAEPWWTATA